jgi:hypothetical protein
MNSPTHRLAYLKGAITMAQIEVQVRSATFDPIMVTMEDFEFAALNEGDEILAGHQPARVFYKKIRFPVDPTESKYFIFTHYDGLISHTPR